MISVKAELDSQGLLRRCEVRGHAGTAPKGFDLVCAAVSALTRTALVTLGGRGDVSCKGGVAERGTFWIETAALNEGGRAFLEGAGGFLLDGLKSVADEYPQNCEMIVRRAADSN